MGCTVNCVLHTVDRVRLGKHCMELKNFMNHELTSIYKTTLLTRRIGDSLRLNLGFKYLICVKNQMITSLQAAGGTALKLRGTPAGG